MTETEVRKLLDLPARERAELAARLWESLEHEALPLNAEEKALLDERIAEADAHPEAGIPWEQVKAEIWPEE